MRNLLNCHSIGLHSFPVSFENGLYKRIFYAAENHRLNDPSEIAIHAHHVDIKITVLEGELCNRIYEVNKSGFSIKKYRWNSEILNGNGGFFYLGLARIKPISSIRYKSGESFSMKACELHTVTVGKNKICAWMIEESKPSCEYFPINYSIHDLRKWTPDGLYQEVNDEVKESYIGKYLK